MVGFLGFIHQYFERFFLQNKNFPLIPFVYRRYTLRPTKKSLRQTHYQQDWSHLCIVNTLILSNIYDVIRRLHARQ
jgi:hypothetical protein